MRALYHRDALILTVTGGPYPLTSDEVIDVLERASRDGVYSATGSPPLELDEHAAIITGRIRRRLPSGGFEDAAHVWLLIVRDGLIYRQGVFSTTADAAAAYATLGITLGAGSAA